jgi:hypothetical protein
MQIALMGRGLRTALTLVAVGTATLTAAGASAAAATHLSQAPSTCMKVHGQVRVGHIGGIVRAVPAQPGCRAQNAGDPANGTPPLIFHGGAVMGTQSTGPVVVTPIFWNPASHPMASDYKNIISTYLGDVAAASGQHTNVFSTLNEYFGNNGAINYQVTLGTSINDTSALPRNGCKVAHTDTSQIYADNSGYDACLDDNQVIAETDRLVTANGLPRDLGHIYVMFLPKHVESCFNSGSTTTASNACTINFQPSAAYCAYHSQAPSGTVYANLPFPVYSSATGFTCGSDARFPAIQTPNGNPDADTEVSPTSHEINEAITDPDTETGWYDSSGFENGDECAYIFGATGGQPGALFNQTFFGLHFLTQQEFSNRVFNASGGKAGCVDSQRAES